MKKQELGSIGLVARILGFPRDHNQHCYTAEELADRENVKRDDCRRRWLCYFESYSRLTE